MSNIRPTTWWNQQDDSHFGISREWLLKAKDIWLSTFDWRKHESYINDFLNFKVTIKETDSYQIDVHFAALFLKRKDAIPIIFLHSFPSSFMDFLPMMGLLRNKFTLEGLPYHFIAPSLPDYGLSGSLSQDLEMTLERAASIINGLIIALGFEKGYITQGGDLGSMIARLMSVNHKECKAFYGMYSDSAGPCRL
jgi:pimeloyl-ACP methyl ester carboxylesterase